MLSKLATAVSALAQKVPGKVYLSIAVTIFGSSGAVIRKLTELGRSHLINSRNPIDFCNVLTVGNLCALLLLLALYHQQWQPKVLRQLCNRDWWVLSAVALLEGAIAPFMIFRALELTMVNNVVLIGRVETPVILILSVLLLHERVNLWVALGASISFIGVGLTILLGDSGGASLDLAGKGELMALGGAIALALSTIISKVGLREIPLGIFSIYKTALGTVIFSVLAVWMFGWQHFADAFSPFVWQWMLFYGAVIVVGGQLSWSMGLRRSPSSEVSLASSFSPMAGILAAYLLLGEVPTMAQYIGGVVILAGIGVNQWGVLRQGMPTVCAKEMDMHSGFKGV